MKKTFIQFDFLRHIRDFEIVKTRDKPMKTENRIKKKIFADSIFRKSSQFERVEGEIIFQNQENLN